MRAIVAFIAILLVSCSSNRPEQGGFYSWVDAQGNVVTVARQEDPAPESAPEPVSEPEPASHSAPGQGEISDEEYLAEERYQTDEEVSKLLEARERDRFVVYQDASGYQIRQSVDVVAAREAREVELSKRTEPFAPVGFAERVEAIPAACCTHLVEHASVLEVGREALVSFASAPFYWLTLSSRHPAETLRLDAGVRHIRMRSFLLPTGYLHPQALFLDARAEPILLIDNLFVHKNPRSWHRFGSLEGDIEVPPGAQWVVLFLSYAGESANGRPELVPGQYLWREPSANLAVTGELVVRAFGQPGQ